eukprot:UN11469
MHGMRLYLSCPKESSATRVCIDGEVYDCINVYVKHVDRYAGVKLLTIIPTDNVFPWCKIDQAHRV